MKKIDKAEYEKRLNKITQIFEGLVVHADEQSTYRCPYKNRFDHCTAKFGCRNQRKIDEGTGLLCVGDDKLDYRRRMGDRRTRSSSRFPRHNHMRRRGLSTHPRKNYF